MSGIQEEKFKMYVKYKRKRLKYKWKTREKDSIQVKH